MSGRGKIDVGNATCRPHTVSTLTSYSLIIVKLGLLSHLQLTDIIISLSYLFVSARRCRQEGVERASRIWTAFTRPVASRREPPPASFQSSQDNDVDPT